MKQYCRYCSFCCYGDAPYCTAKETVLSESTLRKVNHCKEFDLSPLGNVETGKPYQERQHLPAKKSAGEQMRIEL